MARVSPFRAGLALFVIFVLDFSTAEEKCRSGCQGITPHNFKYAEGTTYKYNLESNIDISLSSAEGQQSSTKLKATVLLTQQPQCVQVLRLSDVQIVGSDGKKHGAIPDLDKPITINFHDGHVEDVICAEHGDTQNSLNIKRAVASLFQSAMKHHHETDVFGVCPTEFHSHKAGNIMTVTKSRFLNRCSHRENVKHDFMATAFNLHSEIKSSPILKSDYTAEQRIKEGVLDHILVTENYLYMPFSVGKNGARTVVQTKLQLAGKSKDSPKVKCNEPKSIIFENPHQLVAEKSDVSSILQAVKETANSIGATVGDKTAGKFSALIKTLASAKKDDLLAVYNQVRSGAGFNDKVVAKRVFLDALFRAGTGECIEVAIELLKNKELSTLEQKMVFLGMAFVRHATPSSIAAVTVLLDVPNLPREAYLGAGTLVARYCKLHDCKNVEQLNKLTQKLLSKLKDGKASDKHQEEVIISVLKTLANMKYLANAAVPKIAAIAQDKKASARVRVAALEAFQADPCKDKIRDSAIGILKDIQQDSEIRIKAYLALAQCPNGKVANVIKTVLDNEPSYQVGGFIVSHIRNLRASANPDKELAKRELANVNTMKRFPIDPRKYSYNGEFSYALDTLGTSTSVENNIIYSQNSFTPRSACVNLTTEIFGHKFNFLEIDARQENLDKVLEHYFGPLGYLRNKDPEDLLSSGKATVNSIVQHLMERFKKTRGKRHVPKAEIEAIAKQVQIKSNDLNNDLDLDMSVKIFGSEFMFLSLNDDAHKYTPEVVIDKIFDAIDSGLDKMKHFQHTFRSNVLFLDAELSYPTSMGFPLKLSVEGTASVQMKAAGGIDLRAFLNGNNEDILAKASLIPSANVEIAGRMIVDTSIAESGLKVVSNLYTATGGALEIEFFNNGNGVDVKLSLPIQKQQLLQAKHDIVFTSRDAGAAEHDAPLKFIESKDFSICLDQLSPIIGLTACAELNSPNYQLNQGAFLPFPLGGNAKVGVWIEKENPMTYHVRDVFHSDPNKQGFDFIVEAISEKSGETVSFVVEGYVTPEKYIKASLNSPIKKAVVEGRIIDNDKERSVSVRFQHDNEEYSGKFGVGISGNEAKATYTPLIEYKTPGQQGAQKSPYTVEGTIVADKNGENLKYTFNNVKMIVPNQKPITITGHMGKDNGEYNCDITVGDGTNSGTLRGNVKATPQLIKVNLEMQNSMSPISNFHLDYNLKHDDHSITNDLSLVHGQDLSSAQNKFALHNTVVRNYKNPQEYKLSTKNKVTYPLLGLEAKLDFNKEPKTLEYHVEGKYNNIKVGSEMELHYNEKTRGDYDFEFQVDGFDNKVKAEAKREITGDKSNIENSLTINAKKLEVKGTVTHKAKPNDVQIGAHLVFTGMFPEPVTVDNELTYIPHELKTHFKMSRPSIVYVDFDLAASKTSGANGHLKAAIPEIVNANGEIKADKWNGKAFVVFELLKIQRKVKFDSTFNLAAPTYDIAFTVHPNFEKDPKKITISSNNQVLENSLDSKNTIDAFGHKLEANVKGSKEGHPLTDGKFSGEIEIILPDETYLAGKLNREMHIVNGIANGNFYINAEQRKNKNTPGRKASLKGVGRDLDLKAHSFDITYNLSLDDSNGKTINGDLAVKRNAHGEDHEVVVKSKLYGSVFPEPLELDAMSSYKNFVGSYDVKMSGGPSSLHLDGKYDATGTEKPLSASFNLDVKTPAKIKAVQWSASGSLLKQEDNVDMSGNTKLFIDGGEPEATVDFNAEGDVKMSTHNGQVKGTVKFQKADPISLALGYGHKEENGIGKCHCDVSLTYAKGKNVRGDVSIVKPSKNEWKVDAKLETPFENAKVTQLQHHVKKSDDGRQVQSDVEITVDGKKYVLNKNLIISDIAPLFKFELTHPDGKIDKLYAKANNAGVKNFAAELVIVYTDKDFLFDGSVDAHVQSIEDFAIILKLDSPKMKLDKIVMEAKNTNNKAAKIIEMHATSNGQNLLKGSTTYKTREEGGKYIVEGSGEFTVKDAKKTGNFKFIRHNLHQDKNGEQGVEISFDAGLGNKAVDAELKITNKQFRVLNSYCEEKKQCAHFEIDSKTNVVDATEYNNELEVNVDLRKLGLSHEFGLKAVTNRKNFILDHTVDIHFQSQENNKYQYSLYLHPKEAGVSLTTPKRQVALEGHIDIPNKGKGPIKGELAMYLNKKAEPNKKTSISGSIEHTGDEKVGGLKAETKFTTPGLAKDMTVSYNNKYNIANRLVDFTVVLDIFNKPTNKVVITGKQQLTKDGENGQYNFERHGTLKSTGMNIEVVYDEITFMYNSKEHTFKHMAKIQMNLNSKKCSSVYLIEFSPQKYHTVLKIFDKELYNIESRMQMDKNSQTVDTDTRIYGLKPASSHFEMKNYNTLKYTINPKDNPSHQFAVNAAFIPGQIADFRVQVDKSELVKASLKLDEANFLKPDCGVSTENIRKLLLEPVQKEFSKAVEEGKSLVTDTADHFTDRAKMVSEIAKKNIPNLKPASDYYTSELGKLKEEIAADKTIQEVSDQLNNIFGATAKVVAEILKKANEFAVKFMEIAKTNCAKISEMIEKDLGPRVKQMSEVFLGTITQTFDSISKIFFTIFGKISEFLDAHQAEFKQIATTFSAITQDVGRFLYLNYERVRQLLTENCKRIYEELKALPVFEEFKTRYEMLMKDVGGMTEPFINVVKEALNTLKDAVPNEDVKILIASISDYFEKKMLNEKVDDLAVLQNIAHNAVVIIKKLFTQLNVKGIKFVNPNELSFNFATAIPKLVAAKLSPLSYLSEGELPVGSIKETLYGITFNPKSWIPPFRMYAFLVQGQHVFTFDGKHITFPGKCNYLLARDAVNGNFTIAGTYTDGLLTALTVADKTDSITLKKGGQAMLNKDASEFPIRRPQIEAFRLYDSVSVVSRAGVRVVCDPQLLSCTFSVSGFYHGQLRGLLGNGNNEPYDDFVMANGKIVTSESDFGNSYKMASSCPPIKCVDHSTHHHAASCTELFSQSSTLRYCYPFVNVDNFRTACDHGVSSGIKDTERAVAMGYVSACNAKYIPVRLPEQFLKCENSDQLRSIGDKFSVKVPAKAADVIIIVDQDKHNEALYKELVQPLVGELTKELGAKGITDVEYHLIGSGGEYDSYPSHHTNGGKLGWKGKLPTMKFTEPRKHAAIELGHTDTDQFLELIRELVHDAGLAAGSNPEAKALKEAYKYPFRAHAAKTVIAFMGHPCEQGKFLPLQKLRVLLYEDKTVNLNLVTSIRNFKVKDAKTSKTIIGFDNEHIFTFADAKKNPDGSSELYKDLEYDDYCIDYVLKVGGHVFSYENFNQAKGPAKKQYISTLTHHLVDDVVSHEQGLDCECKYDGTRQALNQCKVSYTKDKSPH